MEQAAVIDVTIAAAAAPGGAIAGLAWVPPAARWLYVLGHGAGAGMRHHAMAAIAEALAARSIATLRWEMPGRTAGRARPDPAPLVMACARAAAAHAHASWPALRLCAGGKSMGGRMTSQAQAEAPLPAVEALVFLGFPLHPPTPNAARRRLIEVGTGVSAGTDRSTSRSPSEATLPRPGTERARHLAAITLPMLFVQGDRDALADLGLLRPVIDALAQRARLELLPGVDHGLAAPKKANIDPIARAADAIAAFLSALPPR